jgi:diacylglycerol kinase family enzyme
MKLLIVINPISGGLDKTAFLDEANQYCVDNTIDCTVFKTSGTDDSINLQKVLNEVKPDKVAAAGGDGTILFTATNLVNSAIPMGIIPFGSANGMARELTINPDPISALKELIVSTFYKGLDLILVNNKYHCLHIGDIGINAQIIDLYSQDPNRGMIIYAKYFAREIFNKKLFDYTIEANDTIIKGKTLMIAICNARKFGTGVPLNRDGNPFDGKFELVLMDEVNINNLIRAGLSIFDENYINILEKDVIVCEEAIIHFKTKRLLQLDGEVIGDFDKLELKILKGAIRLISYKNVNFST